MITIQILTVFFAIFCAWLNKWPVVTFRYYGLSREGEKDFHAANAGVKIIMAFALCIFYPSPTILERLVLVLLLLIIQWLVFDIALNVFTKGWKAWDYIGETAKLDRLLRFGLSFRFFKWRVRIPGLGSWAGKIKAAAALLFIIGLNILLAK